MGDRDLSLGHRIVAGTEGVGKRLGFGLHWRPGASPILFGFRHSTNEKENRHPFMPYQHIKDEAGAEGLAQDLAGIRRFALDLEAAGFHRYSDRLCLVQITTPEGTYIVDPLAFDVRELLRAPLEDPDVEIVMHGSDYDLRLLDRDLDIRLQGLFDTQIAAALIGAPGLGLAALLESRLGVRLSKKYQRADWAQRPLDPEMLEYAADDTRHLMPLADLLRADVITAGREAWVDEECRLLERTATFRSEDEDSGPDDLVVRVKGARDLPPRQVTALREALEWRDEIARERDRAPFRVVGDKPLIEAVAQKPSEPGELIAIKGFPRGLAREEGAALIERLERVARLADHELQPYPPPKRRGPGRPPPEVEEMASKLKAVRNRSADQLGLDRAALPSNAVLMAIAMRQPTSEAELAAVDGMRRWQMEVMGRELMTVLRQAG